ncbi:MAG: SxtJ family membrane protein [Thermodesulfobacteriota bacterium]
MPAPSQTSQERAKDTGLALVLLLLLFHAGTGAEILVRLAMAVLVLAMVWPRALAPASRLWFGLADRLGAVGSRVVLSLLFFLVVTPIGLFRRATGADPLLLRQWHRGDGSLFRSRQGVIRRQDLERPY